jgi:hypothetical protein
LFPPERPVSEPRGFRVPLCTRIIQPGSFVKREVTMQTVRAACSGSNFKLWLRKMKDRAETRSLRAEQIVAEWFTERPNHWNRPHQFVGIKYEHMRPRLLDSVGF